MNNNQLTRLHVIEIEILNEVDRICRENGLTYYLVGGTLLGAVRHKGFIPWDDDLDIAMPRVDFEKFKAIAVSKLDSRYTLQTFESDPLWPSFLAKVIKNRTAFEEDGSKYRGNTNGIFVDIFPLDEGNANMGIVERLKYSIFRLFRSYLWQKRTADVVRFPAVICKAIPDRVIIKGLNSLGSHHGDCYLNHGSQYGLTKQTIEKRRYDPPTELAFEGKLFSVPCDYEYILQKIYGPDYMALPPVEKRTTHNPTRLSFDTTDPDEII